MGRYISDCISTQLAESYGNVINVNCAKHNFASSEVSTASKYFLLYEEDL